MTPEYVITDKNRTIVWADNPHELLEIPMTNDRMKKQWADTTRDRDSDWLGVTGGREELVRRTESEGWVEGVEKGEKAFDNLEPIKLPSLRRKRRHGPVGANLDIHKVYAGRLEEAWDIMRREGHISNNLRKTSVEILVDIGANCNMSAEQMFWRGALANMLCNVLMQSGRAVRIVGYFCVGGFTNARKQGENKLTVACVVKDWMDPLELNMLFSITALSGFFRHHGFRAIIGYPYGEVYGGLGHHVTLEDGDMGHYLGENESVRIVIEEIWDEHGARKKLEEFRKMMEATPTEEEMKV